MTKPMYCPMSFANRKLTEPHYTNKGDQHGPYVEEVKPWMECTPDCAWAVIDVQNECYACGMLDVNRLGTTTNWRPLKDDEE